MSISTNMRAIEALAANPATDDCGLRTFGNTVEVEVFSNGEKTGKIVYPDVSVGAARDLVRSIRALIEWRNGFMP